MNESPAEIETVFAEAANTEELIALAAAGDAHAYERLVCGVSARLCALGHRMLNGFPQVRRWEQTDDVLQESLLKLYRALTAVKPSSSSAFFGLAATVMRRVLIDMSRHYYGVLGLGNQHQSADVEADHVQHDHVHSDNSPLQSLDDWTAFHTAIEGLPDDEREVFSLVWYLGLSQVQVSEILDVSTRTVIRRMNRARLQLRAALQFPGR